LQQSTISIQQSTIACPLRHHAACTVPVRLAVARVALHLLSIAAGGQAWTK
jgi:hypothetical protein